MLGRRRRRRRFSREDRRKRRVTRLCSNWTLCNREKKKRREEGGEGGLLEGASFYTERRTPFAPRTRPPRVNRNSGSPFRWPLMMLFSERGIYRSRKKTPYMTSPRSIIMRFREMPADKSKREARLYFQ